MQRLYICGLYDCGAIHGYTIVIRSYTVVIRSYTVVIQLDVCIAQNPLEGGRGLLHFCTVKQSEKAFSIVENLNLVNSYVKHGFNYELLIMNYYSLSRRLLRHCEPAG